MIRLASLPISTRFLTAGVLVFAISGCGSDGSDGAPGAPGKDGEDGAPGPSGVPATELNMTIDSASINSKPVVNFNVTDQDGRPFTGLTLGDLRFTVAKLMPGPFPSPSNWQSYINRVQNASAADAPKPIASAVQATRENNGDLVDNRDGSYKYTFATDVATVGCPAPCQDANGDPLDVSFDDTLTHRIGIQTRGALPMANATFDFVPSGAPVTFTREMVRTDACNVCHDKLEAHDARIEVPYCVTCHNPGSTDPDSGHTVDFRTMIHKIHYAEELPSVQAGGEYAIWGFRNTKHDFSDIVFPPDVRSNSVGTPDLAPADPKFIPASQLACTKCHNADDPKTPDADDFTRSSRQACGSCHEDIDFDETDLTDPSFHVGGPQPDDTLCATCHGPGVGPPLPGTVTKSHIIRARSAKECFQYNIENVAYDSGTRLVTVDFSVTNPNPGTHPNTEAFPCPAQAIYQIVGPTADPEWAQTASRASRLVVDVGWNTVDFNNAQTPGTPPARTIEVNALGAGTVDLGGGTFQVSATLPPLDTTLCANATQAVQDCSGQVAIEGHPAVQDDPTVVPAQPYDVRAVVQGAVQAFSLDGGPVLARREPVDVITKCDRCHDVLSLHGSNRSDSGQLCVMCHNPNGTDIGRRPAGAPVGTPDNKVEESIDFKTMIHAIHAAAETNFDGTTTHGFRRKGIVVYGFGGTAHDYSDLRFSGALWRCDTCHLPDTFKLTGIWEQPAQNGILGTTIVSGGDNDPSNDMKISPTAAVCSSCHDSAVAQAHMELNGALFGADQATIATNVEACAVCHGPGKTSSVELVHAEGFGEEIP